MRAHSTPLPSNFPLPWTSQAAKASPSFPYQKASDGSLTIPENNLGYAMGDSVEDPQTYEFVPPPDEQDKCVVFVHGIDLTVDVQQGYAQTFFKRLWWEGYRGRFVAFRWCTTLDQGAATFAPENEGSSIFNSGEYRSWKGGTSLKKFVEMLRTCEMKPGATISIAAHSLGNACASEALCQGLQVDSYVAMQAAVAASCYDPQAPTLQRLLDAESTHPTPEFASQRGYRGYLLNIANTSGAKLTMYYNERDFWLVTGHIYPNHPWWPFVGNAAVDWINNQINNKPDAVDLNHYYYDYETVDYVLQPRFRNWTLNDGIETRLVSDCHEGMAYVSRSRTGPLGAVAPQSGSIFLNSVNLQLTYGFTDARPDHSGQFQRDIQLMYGDSNGEPWRDSVTGVAKSFYRRLMENLNVAP